MTNKNNLWWWILGIGILVALAIIIFSSGGNAPAQTIPAPPALPN